MKHWDRATTCACSACVCALILVATPAGAHELGRGSAPPHHQAVDDDPVDDDLIISEVPVVSVTDHLGRGKSGMGMKFETDPCGFLEAVENSRSMMRLSAYADDFDDGDDDDQDPADEARLMIGRWLSQHPELVVINDGVAKSCDADQLIDDDVPLQAKHQRSKRRHGGLGHASRLPMA